MLATSLPSLNSLFVAVCGLTQDMVMKITESLPILALPENAEALTVMTDLMVSSLEVTRYMSGKCELWQACYAFDVPVGC